MQQPHETPHPNCTKCDKPMAWHSTQIVKAPQREQPLQVFRCEICGRFKAIESVQVAA